MKTINKTMYRCDFCDKWYHSKYACEWHEKHCKKNPENQHKCFDFCKHLYKGRDDDGQIYFQCMVKSDKEMHSFIAERRRLKSVIESTERMPLECNLHEYMDTYYGEFE